MTETTKEKRYKKNGPINYVWLSRINKFIKVREVYMKRLRLIMSFIVITQTKRQIQISLINYIWDINSYINWDHFFVSIKS